MRPRLAASVALRIASGTSRALPWPKPTRPFSSPTTTSAAKPKRRPPFTTLATRLMWTSLSVNSLSSRSRSRSRSRCRGSRAMSFVPSSVVRHPSLEFQSAFTRGVGQRLDAPVIEIASAVEDHVLDALCGRPLRQELADRLGRRDVGAVLEATAHILFERRRRSERLAFEVVDHLGIDVLGRAEHRKPLTVTGGAADAPPYLRGPPQRPINDCRHRKAPVTFSCLPCGRCTRPNTSRPCPCRARA